jgi:hypothetical protein
MNKKLTGWIPLGLFLLICTAFLLYRSDPGISAPVKIGLVLAAFLSGSLIHVSYKFESITAKLTLRWVARFGVWFFAGYLLHKFWDWESAALMATFFIAFDWRDIQKAKEKQRD